MVVNMSGRGDKDLDERRRASRRRAVMRLDAQGATWISRRRSSVGLWSSCRIAYIAYFLRGAAVRTGPMIDRKEWVQFIGMFVI